jgi:hypothetical protein
MNKTEWALNLIENEHFRELFAELKSVEMNKIVSSDFDEVAKRERAYTMISAYDSIYSSIEAMATSKKIHDSKWKIF